MKVTVINLVAFKVAWLLTVAGAAAGHGVIGPLAVTFWVACFLYWQNGFKNNLCDMFSTPQGEICALVHKRQGFVFGISPYPKFFAPGFRIADND